MKARLLPTILAYCLALCATSLSAATPQLKYFSPTGSDDPHCAQGSAERPWRSLELQSKFGCISAGMTLALLPGDYRNDSAFFFTRNGRINFSGTKDHPIIIKAQSIEKKPKFFGPIIINGSYLTLEGVEFVGDESGAPVLAIGGVRGIRVTQGIVRGPSDSWKPYIPQRGDCIKIVSDAQPTQDIGIEGNAIFDCREDAIDINGAENVVIHNNVITRSSQIQIKGGASNIQFTGNKLSSMNYGVLGQGMDCSDDLGRYCGSYELLKIAPAERFQADNLLISENEFSGILRGVSIEPSGWHNATIIENRIQATSLYPAPAIRLRKTIGSAYTDAAARAFCDKTPSRCSPCRSSLDGKCVVIFSRARNICIGANEITGGDEKLQFLNEEQGSSDNDICIGDNRFRNTRSVDMKLDAGQKATFSSCGECKGFPKPPNAPNDVRATKGQ